MNYFIMKALTFDDGWYSFTMADIPTMIDHETFVLLAEENSPKMYLKTIRRGDPESGLFEGDIIQFNNDRWLVCYERGFYVINSSYISKYLYQLPEYTFVEEHTDFTEKIVPINFKANHLFKYKDCIFRFNDIVGGYNGKIMVRACHELIDHKDIQQECCMSINKQKVYLGDYIDNSIIKLQGGRVALWTPTKTIDSNGGGSLDGCFSRSCRGK